MNKNQKEVLKVLKCKVECFGVNALAAICSELDQYEGNQHTKFTNAYLALSKKEEFEILEEFGKWGLKNISK